MPWLWHPHTPDVSLIVAERLSKVFPGSKKAPVHALRDLSLDIAEKEFFVLAGPSGSGKTTLLRLIAGLETLSDGRLSIAGKDMERVPARERDIAMVFQNPALFPHMTARENIGAGLAIRKTPKAEREQRVADAASLLGIIDCLDRLPEFLSGGERQRVALGRVVVRRPKIVLFDEPLSNLDAPLRSRMRMELARLHRQLGWTTIYVTHDQAEAMTLATRLAVLHRGELQQVAEPLRVYNEPANVFTAGFLGAPPMNVLPFNDAKLLGVRPENLILVPPGHNHDVVKGAIEFIERLGAEIHFHVRTAAGPIVWRTSNEHSDLRVGDTVSLAPRPGTTVFFDRNTGSALS